MGFNKVILTGKIVNVPRTYYPKRGSCLMRLILATDDQGKEEHPLVLMNELAERAEKQLKQGMLLFVEGTLHYHQHQFSEIVIYESEVRVSAFEVLSNPKEKEEKDEVIQITKQFIVDINELLQEDSKEPEIVPPAVVDDDLPF